jgi:hypothetical protein
MKAAFTRTLVAVLLTASCAAFAHHSFAMFDQSKQVSLKGTIREFQWTNPHAFIHIDVADDGGTQQMWQIEMNSPNNLRRQGWKSNMLKPGDKVTIVTNPLRDGKKGGLFVAATLADGTQMGDPTRARGGPINVPAAR